MSLTIGFTVATLTVIIGTIIGSISGYFGGRTDEAIMRITDIFFAVLGLILALAFVAALQAVDNTIPLALAFSVPIIGSCIFTLTSEIIHARFRGISFPKAIRYWINMGIAAIFSIISEAQVGMGSSN